MQFDLPENSIHQYPFSKHFYFTLAEKIVADHIPVYQQLQSIHSLKTATQKDLFRRVSMGFEDYNGTTFTLTEKEPVLNLPVIVMKNGKEVVTKEVVIKAKTPFVDRKIDRTIINPDALLANAGTNALEVLEKSPGVRMGVAKKILKNKATVKLNVNDLFYTNQPGENIKGLYNSTANWHSYLDTRVMSISFSYRFNSGQTLNARQTGSSDSEKTRVK